MKSEKSAADEVRKVFGEILTKVSEGKERLFIERRGKKVVVMLPIEDARLLTILEDAVDIRESPEVLNEDCAIILDELSEEYGTDTKS